MSKGNSYTAGVYNVDQNYYKDIPTSQITSVPSLNLAILYNVSSDKSPDVQINLNSTQLSWNDFSTLFFKSPSGAFYINPSNENVGAISFSNQTYETTNSKNVRFTLASQIRKAWSKNNSLPESAISPKTNIELERVTFLTKSLGSVYGEFVGLSYDEALSALLSSGDIVVGDSDNSASVKFLIGYQFYFQPLDTILLTTFTFITQIPGYKNSNYFTSDKSASPYSNDTKTIDRTGIDLNDDVSVFSDFESKAYNNSKDKGNNDLEEYSIVSNNSSSNKSNIISEISKIINGAESIVSSEW
jgi:hypothetical protein